MSLCLPQNVLGGEPKNLHFPQVLLMQVKPLALDLVFPVTVFSVTSYTRESLFCEERHLCVYFTLSLQRVTQSRCPFNMCQIKNESVSN